MIKELAKEAIISKDEQIVYNAKISGLNSKLDTLVKEMDLEPYSPVGSDLKVTFKTALVNLIVKYNNIDLTNGVRVTLIDNESKSQFIAFKDTKSKIWVIPAIGSDPRKN